MQRLFLPEALELPFLATVKTSSCICGSPINPLPPWCPKISARLGNIVQVDRCQVLNQQPFERSRRESRDDLEIAPAVVAYFHPHSFALLFLKEVPLRSVIFVPAIHTLQP